MYVFGTEIIVSADLHGHAYEAYSTIDSDGYNSRLLVCASVLEALADFKRNREDELPMLHLFAGDWMHSRSSLNIVVVNLLRMRLEELYEEEIHTKAVKGNHDLYYRRAPETSLSIFEPHLEVIEGGQTYELVDGSELFVYAIPFNFDVEVIREGLKRAKKAKRGDRNVILMHYGISGAVVGPHDYKLKTELTRKEIKRAGYDWVFCGHYHTMQDLGDGVIVPGSPIQHNFGEREHEKGFLVIDLVEGTWEDVSISAPEFVVVRIRSGESWDGDKGKLEGNYTKFVFDDVEDFKAFESQAEELLSSGVLSVMREVRGVGTKNRLDSLVGGDQELSLQELVYRFVDEEVTDGKSALKELGMLLIEMAEEEMLS